MNIFIDKVIKPNGVRDVIPNEIEGQILATADRMAHLTTGFYPYLSWIKAVGSSYEEFSEWVNKNWIEIFTRRFYSKMRKRSYVQIT